MRFVEFRQIQNAKQLNEGARIDHAEDIIFTEGSKGVLRVLEALKSLEQQGHKNVTVKWDGSPAVIFGRDQDGNFILTDKSGFTAKGYDGKAKSPDELLKMLTNRPGANNPDPKKAEDYKQFAANMKTVFPLFEAAVPKDYVGFFKGDMLYFTTPQIQDGNLIFEPNIVEYAIDVNSDLGKRIKQSKAGVVIHRQVDAEGNESPLKDKDIFQGNDLLVMPPITMEKPAQIDNQQIKQLESRIKANAGSVDQMLDLNELAAMQLKDLPKIFYTYMNSKVDTGIQNLAADFAGWLERSPKISDRKKAKILQYIKEHAQAFKTMWQTVMDVLTLKNTIISQFDKEASVQAKIHGPHGGEGGEGYVLAHPEGDIKLVPRAYFSKANRAKQR